MSSFAKLDGKAEGVMIVEEHTQKFMFTIRLKAYFMGNHGHWPPVAQLQMLPRVSMLGGFLHGCSKPIVRDEK